VAVNDPAAPPAATVTFVEPRLKAHGAAACVTVYVKPPIVSVPARGDDDVFGCTTKFASRLPDPDDEVVSHGVAIGSVTVAVHEQTLGAMTPTDPAAPAAGTLPFADWSA
jgi:hypothetical protein